MPGPGLSDALQRTWWRRPPSLAARALQPLSLLYCGLAALHRRVAWPEGVAGLPVVVVGNLIVGGAGKTPTTLHLVSLLRQHGFTPGVVSRGHGRAGDDVQAVEPDCRADEVGDEPLLIRLRAGVPVSVGRDRVAALRALHVRHPAVDIVVSDDGLQHHRLARDVQVIVFDERGVGNGLCLPAGPLREPLLGAEPPPRSLVLYNAARPSTAWPGWIAQRRLSGVLPLQRWWAGAAPDAEGWQALRGRPLLAAAGVAAPERFFALLEAQGLQLHRLPLPDHHDFARLPWPVGTQEVVVTEKDAVKLRPERVGPTRVWVATLDFQPDPDFDRALLQLLAAPGPTP